MPSAQNYFRTGAPAKPKKTKKKQSAPAEATKPATKRPAPRKRAKNVAEHDPEELIVSTPGPPSSAEHSNFIEIASDSESSDSIINGIHELAAPSHKSRTFKFKSMNPPANASASSSSSKSRSIASPSPEYREPAKNCTVYVYVTKPAPLAASRAGKSKAPAAPILIPRGPFFFEIDAPFDAFCALLAGAVGCRVPALNLAQTQWKYLKPQRDPLKSLCNDNGYKALKISLADRTKDLAIDVHVPPPLLLQDDLVRSLTL